VGASLSRGVGSDQELVCGCFFHILIESFAGLSMIPNVIPRIGSELVFESRLVYTRFNPI
jgi:hypothetical protein